VGGIKYNNNIKPSAEEGAGIPLFLVKLLPITNTNPQVYLMLRKSADRASIQPKKLAVYCVELPAGRVENLAKFTRTAFSSFFARRAQYSKFNRNVARSPRLEIFAFIPTF
jgi:hypothetical protein